MYGVPIRNMPPEKVQFMDIKKVLVWKTKFSVFFVPGHAPGHVVFHHTQSNVLINGDCLFRESIGRTDLPGGNHIQLISSIKNKLFTLPDNTTVYVVMDQKPQLVMKKRTILLLIIELQIA